MSSRTLCTYFFRNGCRDGASCPNSHNPTDRIVCRNDPGCTTPFCPYLHPRTPCRFSTPGKRCRRGPRCGFAHRKAETSATAAVGECEICAETVPLVVLRCHASATICVECLQQHIHTEMNDKMFTEKIKCPTCSTVWEHQEVMRLAATEDGERFERLVLHQTLKQMPDFRFCKKSGCGSGQIHADGDRYPIMTCFKCRTQMCYTHDVLWHSGETCEAYDARKGGEDDMSRRWVASMTRPCPKCKVPIEKNGGCDHMTCRVASCQHEFCWLCSAPYDRIRRYGNHHHRPTCTYYAAYDGEDDEEDD